VISKRIADEGEHRSRDEAEQRQTDPGTAFGAGNYFDKQSGAGTTQWQAASSEREGQLVSQEPVQVLQTTAANIPAWDGSRKNSSLRNGENSVRLLCFESPLGVGFGKSEHVSGRA
jgi:hypothetical protein